MNTSKITKKQSSGFTLFLTKAKNMPLTSKALFRDDEKLIYTRRLQMIYMLLSGYSYPSIEKKLGCSRNTISQVKKSLSSKRIDNKKLLAELSTLFKKL